MTTAGLSPKPRPQVSSAVLLLISAGALIAIDLSRSTVATGVGALALAAFVVAYLLGRPGPRFGIYGLLIAELSPISLSAQLPTALLYQAFAALLLTATIAPLPHLAKLSVYAKPASITTIIAAVSLAPGLALVYSKSLTTLQTASLSGAILLVLTGAILFVRLDSPPVRNVPGA